MRNLLLSTLAGCLWLAGCGAGDREVVVTREQFGERWPLEVNSAVVVCQTGDAGAVLKLGPKRYALDESARARGLPDAEEVASSYGPGGVAQLSNVCTSVASAD